jgi:alcohol dehydrogenase (cytochrome c)
MRSIWPPIAFSPKTRMIYVPANENMCGTSTGQPVEYTPGRDFMGVQFDFSVAPGADDFGEVPGTWTPVSACGLTPTPKARTGEGCWRPPEDWFSGGTTDRHFHAFDASTGKLLSEFPSTSGILAPPTSFAIDGKQ